MTARPPRRRSAALRAATAGLTAVLIVGGGQAASARAASSLPAFVQQVTRHASSVASLKLTPSANVTAGNRLLVTVGVWNSSDATAASVTDSAGNRYVELLHFTASDGTEMSVWSAPITAGGGTTPTITVTPTATTDLGAAVSEYSGLSTVSDATVVDQAAHATGTTGAAASVTSGPTAATAVGNELAIGLYVDSGFGDSLTAGSGWTQRSSVSAAPDIELLGEDQVLASAGATPNAAVGTGAGTIWLMATVVLKSAQSGSPATAPAAPTGVSATAGNAAANVSWNAPGNGGSPITSYTVTPYIGTAAQTPTTVSGSPPATSTTIAGLSNGTTYTFTVTATNAVGPGPASSASTPVTPSATGAGQWGPVMSWPMVAIHSLLLDNGKVLQWDGWQQPEPTQVWTPSSGTFTTQTAPDSIFCSGMTELPDGRVLVVGGYGGLSTGNLGIVDTNIFDPATSRWTRVANMQSPRWYPDLTELANGDYVAISGNTTSESAWADTPEVYDPTANTWTALSKVSTAQVHEQEYPFSYLVPNGDVFTIGPSEDKSFLLNTQSQSFTQVGGSSGVVNGSSVMYRPGKILYSGGTSTQDSSSPAHATAATIDLTAPSPTWQPTAPMHYPRAYHTLTMLADGTVLAVGGETTWGQTGSTEVSGGVLPSEIWNPGTQAWSVVASTGVTRGYHSSALLMPDATVLVAGSGHANPNFPGQSSAQIYSPAYLSQGPRPKITSAPATAVYGATIPVSTPDATSISAVNLVSLGADTHQSDMDQHFVPLSFTQGAGGLNVQIPGSAATAPPGNYMLFIVNSSGVPSVAAFVNVSATAPTAPSPPTAVTAQAASGGATVSWSAPSDGGSPITSYTVTPYIGLAAQAPTTVTGSPPTTATTVTGLTNGTSYTFSVTAANAVGPGQASSPSNAVTPTATPAPAFVQAASAHASAVSSLIVTPTSNVTSGDRIVVQAGVWSAAGATAAAVTDTAGNHYVELLHYQASDGTEMSVWTAPLTAGGATRPTIKVTTTAKADVAVGVLEYSGLSTVADATAADQLANASGTTSGAKSVTSGATAATTAGNELAIGLYADSGFGDTLTTGSGYSPRLNISNAGDMELLAEDQAVATAGATPSASVGTGANTIWMMSTIVLKGAPANTGNAIRARGSTLSAALASRPATRSRLATRSRPATHDRRHRQARRRAHRRMVARLRSLHRAAAITAADRARFVYEALIKHLSQKLFCFHGKALLLGGGNWTGAWLRPRST